MVAWWTMASRKRTLKIRTYTVVSEAVERGVECGLSRAYKHSDEVLSESQRTQIVNQVARATMEMLDDVIDWGDDDE